MFTLDAAFSILTSHRINSNFIRRYWSDGFQKLLLFISYFLSVERNRGLHSNQGKKLKEMIGYHVTKGS
jgi:hypothetical protein